MTKEAFIDWNNPRNSSLLRVEQCEGIVNEYLADGLKLTLRQLYYQLVARGWIENTERSYKNIGTVLSQARLAGLIDWEAIEDRGRQPRTQLQFNNIQERIELALANYRLPRWEGQKHYVELWVEKEALAGVLEPLAREFHITLMVNKGYSSQSAMYESAKRILENEKDTIVFYLGDHDPSGEDMVRDVRDRLTLFTRDEINISVRKLALTIEQVQQFRPPPNPAKLSDTRAAAYVAKYGRSSWEVDALNPRQLQTIIRNALRSVVNMRLMNAVIEREEEDKDKLREVSADL
jgi:hypothetical protein